MHTRLNALLVVVAFLSHGLAPAYAHEIQGPPLSAPPLGANANQTTHFSVYCVSDQAFATELGKELELHFARYLKLSAQAGLLPKRPSGSMPWLCVEQAGDVGAYWNQSEGVKHFHRQAFYSSQADTVVLIRELAGSKPPIGAYTRCVSHELAHQMAYRSGLQTPGVMYGFWISEGLAMNFETTAVEMSDTFAGANLPREQRLCSAYEDGRLADLQDFICLIEAPAIPSASLDAYAQAWGLVQMLYARHPAELRRYLQNMALRLPGQRPALALKWEFEHAFGPLDLVRAEWLSYLEQLSAKKTAPST